MKSLIKLHGISRVHLVNPNHQEVDKLVKKYDLHEIIEDDLKESNTQDKIDVYDKHIFLVLHFPKYQEKDHKYYLNEFNIILGNDFILSFAKHHTNTIEKIRSEYLADIKEADEEDKPLMVSPYYILYRIIDELYDKSIVGLNRFSKDLIKVEEEIFEGRIMKKSLLNHLLIKSRNVAFLKNMIEPHAEIIEELNKATIKLHKGDLDVYFEDLEFKVDKISNQINTLSEHTESLSNKYNTLATLKTNNVVTILTIVTVIVGFLTLFTGFYGMNVELPGADLQYMWIGIGGFMFLLAVVLLIVFKKKGWL